MTKPIRLMMYDKTETSALGASWVLGARLYRRKGDVDSYKGISSLKEGLEWIANQKRPVKEVQFWGHGWFGYFVIDGKPYRTTIFKKDHLKPLIADAKAALTDDALWWFRTCCTFGGGWGHSFAQGFAEGMGCTVAGHTHLIGPWQSGLHTLKTGQAAYWSKEEGRKKGHKSRPTPITSMPWSPNTIFCTRGNIPSGW